MLMIEEEGKSWVGFVVAIGIREDARVLDLDWLIKQKKFDRILKMFAIQEIPDY